MVLADCERALDDYEAGANTPFQWTRWVAVTTLLRSVGLVLAKVDYPASDDATRGRMDAAWKSLKTTKPEPRIFHDFIEAERDGVVHRYDVGAQVNVNIQLGARGATYEFVMRSGPFAGHDSRELCRKAIQFWQEYLAGIEGAAP
jgi:hypothetical protein